MKTTSAFVTLALSAAAYTRTFTVTNNCAYTIWPAIFTDLNVGTATPSQPTGWEADTLTTVTFSVPDNWASGRIWGRRSCNFSDPTNTGPGTCADGGCNGGLLCDPHSGTGVPPATVAEFTLGGGAGGTDWYDVSVVDGFNLPIRVDNDKGCSVASCPVDLIPGCPSPLLGPYDSTGAAVGCMSACDAGLAPDPANSPNCCTGDHGTAATCPPSGVQYYSYFKDNCPDAYAYAYDESSNTALWQCDAGLAADYTITFCPS
ncbi:hypothetical protein NM688_g7333 [Phlebia brevispora]|uniref:Uncharacterized protein n=1 Tax=Phlebia brevispora TaxID=194682 RepID=A0ACC1S6J1_9APHY|nr:hypothetical protein NM688_g7333 [Phlebia brevispora]